MEEIMVEKKTKIGTINIAPTWRGLLPVLIEVYNNAEKVENRKAAWEELVRMANAADAAVAMPLVGTEPKS
jgi:hypothetical protein